MEPGHHLDGAVWLSERPSGRGIAVVYTEARLTHVRPNSLATEATSRAQQCGR